MAKDNPSFSDVLDIHFSLKFNEAGYDISTSMDTLFHRIEVKAPDCFASNQWKTFKEAAPKTAKIFVARAIAEFHRIADARPSGTLVNPVHITFTILLSEQKSVTCRRKWRLPVKWG